MKTAKPVIKVYLCMIVTLFSINILKAQAPEKKVKHHENGQIESETFYNANNEPVGTWKFYHDNGQLKNIGEVRKGTFGKPVYQIGEWSAYHKNGKLESKGTLNNGYKEGIWNFYYDNGKPQATGSYGYFEEMQGEWKFYNPNGNLAEVGSFDEGTQVGIWKHHHENGKLAETGNYREGMKDGEWKYYDEQGKLVNTEVWSARTVRESSGAFAKGLEVKLADGSTVKEGKWVYYNAGGMPAYTEEYEMGKLVKREDY